jgi:hypothetical protein
VPIGNASSHSHWLLMQRFLAGRGLDHFVVVIPQGGHVVPDTFEARHQRVGLARTTFTVSSRPEFVGLGLDGIDTYRPNRARLRYGCDCVNQKFRGRRERQRGGG